MIVTDDFNFKLPSERIHNRETRFYSIFCNFYRAMLSMRGSLYAMALCLTVCLAVCLSVTSRCSTKTAKHGITQTTPHDSSGILVFRCQRSLRNSTGITPAGAPNAGGVGKIGDFRQIAGYISKTVQDIRMVSIEVE